MKPMILLFAVPLVLAACNTSPRETCLKGAVKDLAVVDRLILETQANIQRGYGIQREAYTAHRVDFCYGSSRYRYGGPGFAWSSCMRPETRYRDKPVAVDVGAEKRKLAELQKTRARLAREAKPRVEQCNALYPATG